MLTSKSIGDKIATARKKMNLSQAQLAQQVSISPQAVGKWERGESLPDITTLNRLAEILGVDLNYFSDRSQFSNQESARVEADDRQTRLELNQKNHRGWDMSESNWEKVDFSGLKNLQKNFSYSNVKSCRFIQSDLARLLFKNTNFDGCDFSESDVSKSTFQKSNLANNSFKNCLLNDVQFTGTYVYGCDMTGADFSDLQFVNGGFEKNTVAKAQWKRTFFEGTKIANIVFEGKLEDCHFEKCSFSKVTFQHATLINTFFKYNVLKGVKFVDCQADRLTYELLKSGKADITGLTLLED
ncbi:MAG: pentapeptide repeat-containing protein [Crocinitomicaceae bacterium]